MVARLLRSGHSESSLVPPTDIWDLLDLAKTPRRIRKVYRMLMTCVRPIRRLRHNHITSLIIETALELLVHGRLGP